MTPSADGQPVRLSRSALLWIGLGSAGILWYYLHLYVNPATVECRALYRSAKTAADSATVDQTIPPSGQRNVEPRTCQFEKRRGEWH